MAYKQFLSFSVVGTIAAPGPWRSGGIAGGVDSQFRAKPLPCFQSNEVDDADTVTLRRASHINTHVLSYFLRCIARFNYTGRTRAAPIAVLLQKSIG